MVAVADLAAKKRRKNSTGKDKDEHYHHHHHHHHGKKSAEATTGEPTSTRVCIKGVPPSFSSIQLRDFLKKEYRARQRNNNTAGNDDDGDTTDLVITDCRVLFHKDKKTSRRIAFAGFQSTQMAQSVIRLFDKSFALTSRLSVEPAYSNNLKNKVDETTTTSNSQPEAKQTSSSSEKKKDEAKEIVKELVSVGANKAKFWANDFEPVAATENNQTKEIADKLQEQLGEKPDKDGRESSSSEEEERHDDIDDDSSQASSGSEEDNADPLANAKAKVSVVSDMDFLRSKQKLVDDLEMVDAADNKDDEEGEENGEEEVSDDSSSSDDEESTASPTPAPTLVPEGRVSDKHEGNSYDNRSEDHKMQNKDEDGDGDSDGDGEGNDDDDDKGDGAANRLFVRNLPFTTTEEDLEEFFSKFGNVLECHVPVDDRKRSKGFAFVTFGNAFDASRAITELDGIDFQGRFLHILPSRQKPKASIPSADQAVANDRPLSYKERQELSRRQEATRTSKGWSASYVRGDAVVDSLADRLGLKKGDILNVKDDLKSGDAAVRLALGETQIIEENREYFEKHGVDMEALVSANPDFKEDGRPSKRSNTSILVKNLPYDTTVEELQKVFHNAGDAPKRILLPPSRTIALVEYGHSSDAKRAFRRLAYRRFKNVPLYLEWAPLAASISPSATVATEQEPAVPSKSKDVVPDTEDEPVLDGPAPSIYIKNLNFSTTEEQLKKVFEKHFKNDVRAVRIPTKLAPLKKTKIGGGKDQETQSLSMGFGFVEFASQESARIALKKLQGILVDGHALELKPSTKTLTGKAVKPSTSAKNPTKLVVRNVPFQASRTELLKLFGSFGQLKRVRVPKKFDGGHRGFAFVEFVTHKEALSAMNALSRTHLYGRHLVLEWAEDDGEDTAAGLVTLRDKAQRDINQTTQSSKRQRLS